MGVIKHKMIKKNSGYTMIEISLSMVFVSVIVIGVVVTFFQFVKIYNKGITMKSVNSAIRTVSKDMKDSIKASQGELRLTDSSGNIATDLSSASNNNLDYYNNDEYGGRLCTGTNTYMWNYRKSVLMANDYKLDYTVGVSGQHPQYYKEMTDYSSIRINKPITFVKVADPDKELCREAKSSPDPDDPFSMDSYNRGSYIPRKFASNITSVFGNGERDLLVYKFSITEPSNPELKFTPAGHSLSIYSTFYSINITVGSSLFPEDYIPGGGKKDPLTGVDYENSAVNCSNPLAGSSTDIIGEYCAINSIKFVALAGSANK